MNQKKCQIVEIVLEESNVYQIAKDNALHKETVSELVEKGEIMVMSLFKKWMETFCFYKRV